MSWPQWHTCLECLERKCRWATCYECAVREARANAERKRTSHDARTVIGDDYDELVDLERRGFG